MAATPGYYTTTSSGNWDDGATWTTTYASWPPAQDYVRRYMYEPAEPPPLPDKYKEGDKVMWCTQDSVLFTVIEPRSPDRYLIRRDRDCMEFMTYEDNLRPYEDLFEME